MLFHYVWKTYTYTLLKKKHDFPSLWYQGLSVTIETSPLPWWIRKKKKKTIAGDFPSVAPCQTHQRCPKRLIFFRSRGSRSGEHQCCEQLPRRKQQGEMASSLIWYIYIIYYIYIYGCFQKWWYPQNTPKWSFLVGKSMVVGYHHFRKPPYIYIYTYKLQMLEFCNFIIHFKIGVFRIITSSDHQEVRVVNKKHNMQTLRRVICHLVGGWVSNIWKIVL